MGHSISKLSVTGGQLYGLITDVQVMKNKMAPENGVKIGVWKWRVKCELYYFRFLPEDSNSPKWLNIQPAQKSKNNYLNYEWKNYELKFKNVEYFKTCRRSVHLVKYFKMGSVRSRWPSQSWKRNFFFNIERA